MNPWYVGGGALAAWAVLVSLVGIARPGFPGGSRGARLVMALSVALVAAAIASAIFGAIAEEERPGQERHAALGGAL